MVKTESSVPRDPVAEQTQRHIAELMEIVQDCRERDRKLDLLPLNERSDVPVAIMALAENNATRVAALVAIHDAKMAFYQYQQMQSAMGNILIPA